jgi:AbrB family looped-hinge helix DNA binding protein
LYLTYVLPDGAIMPGAAKLTTTLSTKGQVILPAAVRRHRNWNAGTRLTVEETPDGVLLKPAPAFPLTTPEQVFGCLRYQGKPKTLRDMQDGIAAEVRRRHARGRY